MLLGACVDQPHCLAPSGSSVAANRLSQLALFDGPLANLTPSAGVVPYDVNVSLYSDEARKQRFIRLPAGGVVHSTDDRWQAPTGTWLIKNFYYPLDARAPERGRQLVETRILVVGASGLTTSTYVWNDDQSDALCSGGNVDVPTAWIDDRGGARSDHFHVPGTSQCQSCHDNHLLGWRTRQLHHDDQMAQLVQLGVVDSAPPNPTALVDPVGAAPLADRARSYFDANCGHCHNAESSADASGTGVFFDFDHDLGTLFCRSTDAVDGRDRVLVPGHPEQSEVFARMRAADAFLRMPRGPTHIPDAAGIAVLTEWVSSLPARSCP
jgi:hypothetical protein